MLCGTPNKGIVISDSMLVGSEFNGASPFLKGLNSGPDDLIPGVELMAIRSDKNDKYSQPDARFVGQPGKPTGVSYDASELRGARNVIIDGLDHRETAFHKLAFAAQYQFITGKAAGTLFITQEPKPTLNGRVTGMADGPLHQPSGRRRRRRDLRGRSQDRRAQDAAAGASQDHRRRRPVGAVHRQLRRLLTNSCCSMAGQPITHTYRSPFLRSSDVVHLRPEPFAKADEHAAAVVIMSRPRGYFGVGRDKFSLDGKVPPGITEGVPAVSTGRLAFDAAPRTVLAVFNNETIPTRTWSAKHNHIVVAEFMN